MSHRRVPTFTARVSMDTRQRLEDCRTLARLLGEPRSVNAILKRALVAAGVQMRRRYKARTGRDAKQVLEEMRGVKKARGPFAGVERKPEPQVFDY